MFGINSIAAILVLWGCCGLRVHVNAKVPATGLDLEEKDAKCQDEGIWIADTMLDCNHLVIKSDWGLTGPEAEKRCRGDSNTRCCQTCRQLGFHNGDLPGSSGNTERPTSAPATAAPPNRTPQALTMYTLDTSASSHGDSNCKDDGVWIMDMSVSCSKLEKPSIYGIHTNPEYYCTNYPLTDCCETCSRLGYRRRGESNTVKPETKAPTTTTTTEAPTTTTKKVVVPPAKPVWPPLCRDIGFFYRYHGMISCKYLEKKSSQYPLREKPLQYCNRWSTWCCETCARLRGETSQGAISYNLWGFKSPTIKKSKTSNHII